MTARRREKLWSYDEDGVIGAGARTARPLMGIWSLAGSTFFILIPVLTLRNHWFLYFMFVLGVLAFFGGLSML